MTHLETRKSRLVFQTGDMIREKGRLREVVIEARPGYANVRLAGMRTAFAVSWGGIYHFAARLQQEKERAEKKAKKAKGKK